MMLSAVLMEHGNKKKPNSHMEDVQTVIVVVVKIYLKNKIKKKMHKMSKEAQTVKKLF